MGKVTTEFLRRFHKKLGSSVSVRTSKEYLTVLKSFFRDAHADKVIGDDPAVGLRETRKPESSSKVIPKLEQVQKVIATIRNERLSDTRHEAADFLTFLAGAGLGNAEAANLLVSHVDLKEEQLRIRRVKTNVEFFVPIYPSIRELLVRRVKGTTGTVGQLGSSLRDLDERILTYNETNIDDQRAHDIVIRAPDAGAITTTQVPEVLGEWRRPSHPEFLPRTAWSLFNAVTEVHKRVNPHTACRRGEALYGLFDIETGANGRN